MVVAMARLKRQRNYRGSRFALDQSMFSGGTPENEALLVLQSYSPICIFDHILSINGVADGGGISTMTDQSSNRIVATGSVGNLPVYRLSGNAGIEFGTDRWFSLGSTITLTTAFTVYAVIYRASGVGLALFGNGSTTNHMFISQIPFGTNTFSMANEDDSLIFRTGAITLTGGLALVRARVGHDGIEANNDFTGTTQLTTPINQGTGGIPDGTPFVYDRIGDVDMDTGFSSNAVRLRHLTIIPELITGGSADDLAIIEAINTIQGTSLSLMTA